MTRSEMERLLREIYDLEMRLHRLMDYKDPVVPGQPASEEAIHAVEQFCHCKLPLDYRLFLSLHNGWERWSGDVALLSTEQMLVGKHAEKVRQWRERVEIPDLWLVIGFSLYVGEKILIDMATREGEVIVWDSGDTERYPNFGS